MRRRRLPSLTSLRNFEAVARHKSFTKAADELCVTQGAVSHQIKILEEELRAKLLTRGRLGVELTALGSKLLSVSSMAFDDLADIVTEIREEAGSYRQRLRVHATPQFCQFWLAPRIAKFATEHPNIDVYVSAIRLDSPHVVEDQALTIMPTGTTEPPELGDHLFESNLMPMCSPALLDKSCKSELLKQSTLLCETDHDWWSELDTMAGGQRAVAGKRLYFDDPAAMVQVALSGDGVLMGSKQLLRDHIARSQLVAPLDPVLQVSRSYHLSYCNKAIASIAAQSFRSWLLSEVSSDVRLH